MTISNTFTPTQTQVLTQLQFAITQTPNSDPAYWNELGELLWQALLCFEHIPFYTAKGFEFFYTLKGNEMFVNRKNKSITRSSIYLAFQTALTQQAQFGCVSGPKKLKSFGASYLYPIFLTFGIITTTPTKIV